jgi:HAMP domain-containing protein
MKTTATLVAALLILLGGCARKSELDAARSDLAEARHKIETLQSQRVPRIQYEEAQASLKAADARLADTERELQVARELIAAQRGLGIGDGSVKQPEAEDSPELGRTALAKGTYSSSNDTLVYSPDALLKFGKNLQITSPSGLMVSDSEQRIVGGDLSIKAKNVLLETSDGVLKAEPDGSVKFTGSTLTMKFENGAPVQQPATTQTSSLFGENPAGPSAAP